MASGKKENCDSENKKRASIPASFFCSNVPGLERTDKGKISLLTRTIRKTREEFEKDVREFSMGLLSLGIMPQDRIAILHENSPEWITSDLAISSAGAISVPVYTTLSGEETLFLLKDASVSAIIFSGPNRDKVIHLKKELPSLKRLISTENRGGEGVRLGETTGVLTFENVKKLGKESLRERDISERIENIGPGDTFSIIYSSGTTGRQRGVVLSHGNILSNIEAALKVIPVKGDDTYLSYLPLSHIFERMMHHLFLYAGSSIAYSKGFAYVGADIQFFRPTILTGVPFFFERLREKILEGVKEAGAVKRAPFNTAIKKGPDMPDGIILKKIREKAAPGLKFFISGGAALDSGTAEFFFKIGLPVLQGYGLTETSPIVTVNTPGSNKIGTVGRPLPGVSVKISEEGEIMVKGPNVMKGYHNMPGEEAKRDGWFYTGDIGFIDKDGFLTITGRKKDLIITSVGKNISPQKIENLLRGDGYIKEAVVCGDNKPHLVALIFPDTARLETLGEKLGIKGPEKLLSDKAIHDFFSERIRARLKNLARFEQIRRFALIGDTLSTEGGELTPTLKIKRQKVQEKYMDIIEKLYESEKTPL